MDTFSFIEKSKTIHGDEYLYEKTKFKNWDTKVLVSCKEHGDFLISPRHHIYRKQGCPLCKGKHISESKIFSQDDIIKKFRSVHGNTYSYENVKYIGIDKEVEIICPNHGVFLQTPYNHIHKKCGCPMCKYDYLSSKFRFSVDELLERFNNIHGGKYEYPNIAEEYVNSKSEITIVCPEHGIFKQKVQKHLRGHGCPICRESKLEKEIGLFLNENKISFIKQKHFDWLVNKRELSLDFYLPEYNVAIECQGEQHFKPVRIFGGDDEFALIHERDNIKKEKKKKNGIDVLYYTKCKNVNGYNIYSNKNELLKKIKTYGT